MQIVVWPGGDEQEDEQGPASRLEKLKSLGDLCVNPGVDSTRAKVVMLETRCISETAARRAEGGLGGAVTEWWGTGAGYVLFLGTEFCL